MSDGRGRLVYSTGPGGPDRAAACPRCASRPCVCGGPRFVSPSDHDVRVRRERKGRKGKTVTVAEPFHLATQEARRLAKSLKSACGAGGTVKPSRDGTGDPCHAIEIQGDHVDRVIEALRRLTYPARRG